MSDALQFTDTSGRSFGEKVASANLMSCRTILFALTFGIGLACSAETIGWWHFDEQDPGGKTTGAAGEIVNSVSSEYGSGKVFSADSTGAVGTDANYYPVYADIQKDANRPLRIYDPVTGETHVNRSSLTFVKDGTASANNGGGVDIPNDARFRISTYTVELFFKSTDSTFDTIAPIVAKVYSTFGGGSESWQIGLLTNGKLFLRYSGGTSSTSSGDGKAVVNDGLWHHLALTCGYDSGTNVSTFKLYVDGTLDMTKTKEGETKQATKFGDIYLGAYGEKTGRKLAGTVDELRISNVALEPEQFLKVAEPDCPPVVSADTLVWMSMDGDVGASFSDYSADYAGRVKPDANWNETTNSSITATLVREGGSGTAAFAVDVTKPFVCCGTDRAATLSTNATSCLLTPDGTAGYSFQLSSYNYCAASFTAEMFFRAPTDGGDDAQSILKSNSHFQLTLNGSGSTGKILLVYWNEGDWKNGGTIGTELRDGQWHHVALVYDQPSKNLKVYLDGNVAKNVDNVTLTDSAAMCYVGSSHDKSQLFKGNIDSVRITKRALEPSEFLRGCRAPSGMVLIFR